MLVNNSCTPSVALGGARLLDFLFLLDTYVSAAMEIKDYKTKTKRHRSPWYSRSASSSRSGRPRPSLQQPSSADDRQAASPVTLILTPWREVFAQMSMC